MNQSEIAIRVANLICLKDEVLFNWKFGSFAYGIYGARQTDLERIRNAINHVTNVDITEKKRTNEIVNARRVFAFISCYTTKDKSLNTIAPYMGVINHATVLHHRNKMKDLISVGDQISINLVSEVCNKLGLLFIKTKELNRFENESTENN